MLNIQCIKNVRHLLTQDATETLVLGTVMSHFDYCSGILADLLDMDISRMQCVQTIAAKMVVQNDISIRDTNFKNILENVIGSEFTEEYSTKYWHWSISVCSTKP